MIGTNGGPDSSVIDERLTGHRRGLQIVHSWGGNATPLATISWIALSLLVVVPLITLIVSSFKESGLPSGVGFTFKNYVEVYTDPTVYSVLFTTLIFGVGSTLIAIVVGATLGFLVERTDMPHAKLLGKLALVPLAIPSIILAASSTLVLSPEIGLINSLGRSIGLDITWTTYSLVGMIVVQGVHMVPLSYLLLLPSFRAMDPSLEEAARVSGASTFRVFRHILIPLVKPALLGVGTFSLIIGLLAFDTPGILGMPRGIYTLGSSIFLYAHPPAGLPRYGEVSALTSSLLIFLFLLAWYYQRQTRHAEKFVTVTGKSTAARRFPLGQGRHFAAGAIWVYVFLTSVLPFVALILASFMPFYGKFSTNLISEFTLNNYEALVASPEFVLGSIDSLVVAIVTASVVAVLAILVSWVVVRSRTQSARALDSLAIAPVAIPGIVMGVVLIFLFLTVRFIPIYGTIWVIVIGSIIISLPFATRVFSSALLQIDRELEEAGRTSGAGTIRALLRITAPLLRPATVVVWVWSATFVLRELALPLMVQSGRNPMFVTVLWGYWDAGQFNVAAAGSVVLISVLLVGIVVWMIAEERIQKGIESK